MNTKQLLPYILLAIGIWLILHLHLVELLKWLSNRALSKMQGRLALDNAELQCLQVEKQIKELK